MSNRASAQHLSTYGTPGLIDMPTAEVMPDGYLGFTATGMGDHTLRTTMLFQMLPGVYGTFRYSVIKRFEGNGFGTRYDRSFDIHFQLSEETQRWPSVALGLRDLGGTGIYSSEYLVATKTLADRFSVTAGLGWGRLASYNEFKNPLCFGSNRFCTRPAPDFSVGASGQINFGSWFRGDAALFAGAKWQANDRLTLLAEYSSDGYDQEVRRAITEHNSPFNFGATYQLSDATQLSAYYMYGSEFGLQLSYVINPASPRNNAGSEQAPPALVPVDRVAVASWNLPDRAPDKPGAQQVLAQRISDEGLELEGLQINGTTATIRIENFRFGASAQAVGRANRAAANTLPSYVDTFVVVLLRNGLPITRIDSKRSDLAELETDVDGAWRSLARAEISDASGMAGGVLEGAYPRFDYRLGPYAQFAFFDPDNPLRADFGVQLNADIIARPGLTFSGQLRQPIFGTIDQVTRRSNSVIPHVRSDWDQYAINSDLELSHLTAEYIWQPRSDVFARVTAGYLEAMYGGVSGEGLWYPVGSPLAVGAELNWTRQRDFDMLFDFRDYNVTTGHASVYYDMGNDYNAQLDMGRYLAGDWGATFKLEREFNNGFKVGGFFTLTTVSFDDFGEGSFDKGITLDIPLTWLTGKPSRRIVNQTIRPVLRDGGARLNVRNRLYQYTRADRGPAARQPVGAVFPMKRFALLLAAALSACASTDDSYDVISSAVLKNQQPFVERFQFAASQGAPELKIALLEFEAASLIRLDSSRDGVDTWITPDGGTLMTRDQMIIGMRGFGAGLMAVDADQTLSMLRSGRRGVTERFHTFLTGNDEIETRTYRCQLADEGTQELVIGTSPVVTNFISEDCRSLNQSFLNLYWVIPGNNRIVQTSQWTGEFIGMVATQVVP